MYIVIETLDVTFPNIITDEKGYPLLFETREEAEVEAAEC